ncbi:hypothetical protein GE061_003368 [Apolygus lucorum]|uniref:HTH CENPB-type domain-containing protein n=1 Tax=Apolygus lucorum TaxID=248454 RepID=A0A8S9X1B6_APOLU|nr:hypothetical protein GE061_003368 [Apolygus lucorum]
MPIKRTSLTFFEKKKLIEAVENGARKTDVAKTFGIPPSTLSNILKKKEEIYEFVGRVPEGGRKRFRPCRFPQVEESLMTWMSECRHQNIPVGGGSLKSRAKSIAASFGIEDFNASEGWLDNFKKRHGISFSAKKNYFGENSSMYDGVC